MSAESVALDHYRDQQRLSNAAAEVAGEAWSRVDPDNIAGSWGQVSPEVAVAVAGAQRAAASQADGYLDKVLGEQGLSPASMGGVNPAAFAGIASDGRPLDSLIRQPAIGTLVAIGSGHGVPRSLAMGGAALDMIVRTQVADAGRGADQVALTARPSVDGYTRLLVPPSCSRCAILAGRWYPYSAGFQRHPRCDCRHIPATEDVAGDLTTNPRVYFNSLTQAEQDRIFTRSGAQAIRDGADMNQVVNARRGMSTAAGPSGRRRLARDPSGAFVTRESTTRRGVAPGQRRLMPEQIHEQARSRDEAIELLRANGYLRPAPRVTIPTQRIAPPRRRPFAERAAAAATGEDALAAARFGLDRRPRPPEFTPEMARAVNRYTSAEYAAVNRFLRGQQLPYGYTPDDITDLIPDLDAALDASKLDRDVLAWRGLANARQVLGDRVDGDLTGVEWREDSYLSLTASERRGIGFAGAPSPGLDTAPTLMRVLVPRGTSGIEASGMQLEAELVLARGLRLRVVADHGLDAAGRRRIDVEVIDERAATRSPGATQPAPLPARPPAPSPIPRSPDEWDPDGLKWAIGELDAERQRQARLTPATNAQLAEVRLGGHLFAPGESMADASAYYLGDRLIRFHPDWVDRAQFMEQVTQESRDARWFGPTGAPTGIRSVLAHEYGHHVHRILETLNDPEAFRDLARTIRAGMHIDVDVDRVESFDSLNEQVEAAIRRESETSASRDEPSLVAAMVSQYGATNVFEMLAEIWQEYSTLGDAARQWIQRVGAKMQELAERAAREAG